MAISSNKNKATSVLMLIYRADREHVMPTETHLSTEQKRNPNKYVQAQLTFDKYAKAIYRMSLHQMDIYRQNMQASKQTNKLTKYP